MSTIRAFIDYSDRTKTHFYQDFEEMGTVPEVGKIIGSSFLADERKVTSVREIMIDCEQSNDEVWNYRFYRITTVLIDEEEAEEETEYICVEKPEEEVKIYFVVTNCYNFVVADDKENRFVFYDVPQRSDISEYDAYKFLESITDYSVGEMLHEAVEELTKDCDENSSYGIRAEIVF